MRAAATKLDTPVAPHIGAGGSSPSLSVVIPALHEHENLALLLPDLNRLLEELGVPSEIAVVTRRDDAKTQDAAAAHGARVVLQTRPGYGSALKTGFVESRGTFIVTMDADTSHAPVFIHDLWACRERAEVVVASRYVEGGRAQSGLWRRWLSRVLNAFFQRGLSLPVRDLSSGFRLYRADLVRGQPFTGSDFDILPEILVRLYAEGWRVREVPFSYAPRRRGRSNARVLPFGLAYLRTFTRLWKLRNSILSADYDDRAFDSVIPLQRYWQRSRYRHVTELVSGQGRVLDVGCGSSRILDALPGGSVALDISMPKLRHARRFGRSLVQASGGSLPFPDASFPCVLSSQVVEHLPRECPILGEMCRVLAPGGRLVLGTPDYDRWEWVWIERAYARAAPGAYADEHITHYTRRELVQLLEARGLRLEAVRYILRAELILAFRKPS
jgi:dolichol-phosphate mannosyltransferase